MRPGPTNDPEVVQLTPREAHILLQLCQGFTSKEIAAGLGTSPGTVNVQVANLCRRLDLRGRNQLVLWAVQQAYAIDQGKPCRRRLHPRGCPCDAIYCTAMRLARREAELRRLVDPAA